MMSGAAALSPDLRKRIEIMAEHIARNGYEFENTVKTKNVNNPQFAFLYYSGEGAEYYNQVLARHRGGGAGGVQQQTTSVHAGSPRPAGSPSAQHTSANSEELAELMRKWKEPPVYPVGAEVDRQLGEVLAALEQMASRDAIRNGRMWMESNTAISTQIAGNVMKRVVFLPSCAHRLHVLYLVHDVLQTEAARNDNLRPLIRAWKPYLAWVLRPCYQLAQLSSPNGDESSKVLRLLQLWVERGILATREAEEMRALVTLAELPTPLSIQQGARAPVPATGIRPGVVVPTQATDFARQMMQEMMAPALARVPYAGQVVGHPAHIAMQMQRPVMSSHVQIPGAIMPGLHGYKPSMLPAGVSKQTPETVPVGVMGTMIAHFIRRNQGSVFVPYRPLDPSATPQTLPPMEVPMQRLLERVEDFYQDLRDEAADDSSGSSSKSSSHSRSRSRSRSPRLPSNFGGVAMNAVPPLAIS